MSGRFHGRPPASANVRECPRTSANVREHPRTSADARKATRRSSLQPQFPSDTQLPTSYRQVAAQVPPSFFPCFPQQPPISSQLRLSFLAGYRQANAKLLPAGPSYNRAAPSFRKVSAKFPSVAEHLVTATARLPPSCRQIAAAKLTPASPEPAPEPVSPSATLAAEPQNTDNPDSRQAYTRHSLPYCAIRRLG